MTGPDPPDSDLADSGPADPDPAGPDLAGLDRSVTRYPLYLFFQRASYWGPVFFLYFNSILSLSDVLLLEAIYYIGVVFLEVPTGYLADRIGARRVLIASSFAQAAACAAFIIDGDFAFLALGQVCLALGMSLGSGSDTAYLYGLLCDSGREHDYGDRESRAARAILFSQATSALLGGAVAAIDLRAAYLLTLLSSLIAAGVAFRFVEVAPAEGERSSIGSQLRACLADAAHPRLAWLLGFYVYMTVVNHIPHEFYQPYIRDIVEGFRADLAPPAVTGIHTAVTMGFAAVAAAYSIRIRDRIGPAPALLLAALTQTVIIGAMAWVASPAVAVLVLLRSCPRGLMQAPLNAEIVPLVGRNRRATYLSLQSLLGRLAFGVVLVSFSEAFEGNEIAAPIGISSIGAALGLGLLVLSRPIVTRGHS